MFSPSASRESSPLRLVRSDGGADAGCMCTATVLGTGSRGCVRRAFLRVSDDDYGWRPVALRCVPLADAAAAARALDDGLAQAQVQPPGAVAVLTPWTDAAAGEVRVPMQLCDGTLSDHCRALGRTLPPGAASALAAAALAALRSLHASGVVHGALRPSNVLVLHRGGGVCVVGEEPQPRVLLSDAGQEGGTGAELYEAPECAAAGLPPGRAGTAAPRSAAADVWALGCTLHEAFAGRHPFASRRQLCAAMLPGAARASASLRAGGGSEERALRRVLEAMLEPSPAARATADSALRMLRAGGHAPARLPSPPSPPRLLARMRVAARGAGGVPVCRLPSDDTRLPGPPLAHGQEVMVAGEALGERAASTVPLPPAPSPERDCSPFGSPRPASPVAAPWLRIVFPLQGYCRRRGGHGAAHHNFRPSPAAYTPSPSPSRAGSPMSPPASAPVGLALGPVKLVSVDGFVVAKRAGTRSCG